MLKPDRPIKFSDHGADVETRPFVPAGYLPARNGHSELRIICPFCQGILYAHVRSLAGSGKRCPHCAALFGSTEARQWKVKPTPARRPGTEHWPTPEIPPAPVSAKTHGDPVNWTKEQWDQFHEWASNLRHYGPAPPRVARAQRAARKSRARKRIRKSETSKPRKDAIKD